MLDFAGSNLTIAVPCREMPKAPKKRSAYQQQQLPPSELKGPIPERPFTLSGNHTDKEAAPASVVLMQLSVGIWRGRGETRREVRTKSRGKAKWQQLLDHGF